MNENALLLAGSGIAAALLLMLATYVLSLRLRFFSIVDVAWAYGFALLSALLLGFGARGPSVWLLSLMVGLWSLRLGTHLLLRITAHYPKEDGRYDELRAAWGSNATWKFLVFFLLQGLSVALLASPLFLVERDSETALSPVRLLAFGLWVVAWIGESVADRQLRSFKGRQRAPGALCEVGLWRYSRHPNYFFEFLIWCSFALFALEAPYGLVALLSPATILYLLFRVTGIPATEAQALRSRRAAYERYQRSTSVFVPWLKKKEGSHVG